MKCYRKLFYLLVIIHIILLLSRQTRRPNTDNKQTRRGFWRWQCLDLRIFKSWFDILFVQKRWECYSHSYSSWQQIFAQSSVSYRQCCVYLLCLYRWCFIRRKLESNDYRFVIFSLYTLLFSFNCQFYVNIEKYPKKK